MILLGINEDHSGTAAIIIDGTVIACASEERFTRLKNDMGYPKKAIDSVLEIAGVSGEEVDFALYSSLICPPMDLRLKRTSTFKIKDYIREMHEYWKPVLLQKKESDFWDVLLKEDRFANLDNLYYDFSYLENTPEEKWITLFNQERKNTVYRHLGIARENVKFVDHHTAHAYYAYYASPHDPSQKASIITADSWGDGCNATISVVEDGRIKEIHRTPMCNMARMYKWITLLLGMKPYEHEYKVMGLAPYAKDYIRNPAYKIFKETLVVDGLDFKWNEKPSDMYFYFKEKLEGIRFDGIAAGLQMWVEELLSEWVTNLMNHTGTDILYYSGGLSMNVKANKVIAELPVVKKLYVPPSGGDESLAMGVAFKFCVQAGDSPSPLENAYLGYEITKEEAIRAIEPFRNNEDYIVLDNPSNDLIADYLKKGKVLGRCVSRMEFGARALGNRSIICDPSKHEHVALINEKIKFRDFWMPFTPSILEESADDYIVNHKKITAHYMTIGFESTQLGREHLKAAIHPHDLTVRPQLVNKKMNSGYYSLISAFKKNTTIGALLNTSLNLHGSPIACCAKDAIEVLTQSGIDGLILPSILILKSSPD